MGAAMKFSITRMSVAGVGLLLACVSVGCGKPKDLKGDPAGRGALAVPKTADLSKPLAMYTWQSSQDKEPLTLAKMLAHAAGGTWLALAPHPLEEIKWTPTGQGYQPMKVSDILSTIQKSGEQVAWESRPAYTLVYFGPSVDMSRIKERPPQEIVGLLMASETAGGLVHAVSDVWRVNIDVDPALLRQREALLEARKPDEDEQETDPNSMAMRFGSAMGTTRGGSPVLELKIAERTTPEGLMEKLAEYLGGEAQDLGDGKWRFAKLSKPERIQAELEKLKKIVEDRTGGTVGFTSYSGRSGGADGSEEVLDPDTEVPIQPLDEQAQDALDRLAMLGPAALDTLRDFLKPENPSLTRSALQALATIRTPESSSALVNFARDLPVRTTGPSRTNRRALAGEVIRVMKREPSAEYAAVLSEIARNPEYASDTRQQARLALAASGSTLLSTIAGSLTAPPEETMFNLIVPPDPKPAKSVVGAGTVPDVPSIAMPNPNTAVELSAAAGAPSGEVKKPLPQGTVKAIATCTAPGGDTWAVFVSGRFGDAEDIWLARQSSGQWTDFLFTGKRFERGQGGRFYGGTGLAIKKGSCILKVEGDKVTLRPPDSKAAAELEKVQKAMNDPKLKMQDRMKFSRRYSEVYEKVQNNLKGPMTLSLEQLRKDGDADGLTDLLEERLSLDPKNPDTDGDREPDGRDRVPHAGPVASLKDRNALLDLVFTTLFTGDPSPEPVVVVLDRQHWQEFRGPSSRVILVTRDEYPQRAKNLGLLRTLQFGGPKDAESTILVKDGPCLFNDGKSRAEVHFWVSKGIQSPYSGGYRGSGTGQTRDYMARFERTGSWKLKNMKPWHYDTSERAAQEMMRKMATESYEY
jgi:hypothetical protein